MRRFYLCDIIIAPLAFQMRYKTEVFFKKIIKNFFLAFFDVLCYTVFIIGFKADVSFRRLEMINGLQKGSVARPRRADNVEGKKEIQAV